MRKFVRTRPPPAPSPAPPAPPAPALDKHPAQRHLNGHANGGGGGGGGDGLRRDEHHSTLSSRYWSGSEGSRGVEPPVGVGGGGGGVTLWEDAEFPPARALPNSRRQPPIQWLRPYDLCSRPSFRGEGAAEGGGDGCSCDDDDDQLAARWSVEVGAAGSAALCCAAAALALTPRLLDRVAPPQTFRRRYTGAFRFKFWVFGEWREVCVDDRLPTRGARPLYSRGALPADFTLPLLEKAYAKLYGSYAAMVGGERRRGRGRRQGWSEGAARALQELSGGVVQSFPLRVQPRALVFQVLNSAVPRSTLIIATAHDHKGKSPPGQRLPSGLLAGQPYCVMGLARVRTGPAAGAEEGEALVLVRAVSGRGAWAGAWAPHSPHWRALPPPDRDLLAARTTRKGDFWMSFAEFAREFSSLELVHVGPDDWAREGALRGRRAWRAVLARRRWTPGYNAGGPPHHTETTSTNPQFHVQVCGEAGRKCHVVVSVTQQYVPGGGRGGEGGRLQAVGFAVYELPPGVAPRRPLSALHTLRALDVTHESAAREVATFFTLPAGQYLVVPHTRRPHTAAAFLLRILTDENTTVWEVNEDNMIIRDISTEFTENPLLLPAAVRGAIAKVLAKTNEEELDAVALRGVLRAVRGAVLGGARVTLELCRALVALYDARVSGRLPRRALPPLLARVWAWRAALHPAPPSPLTLCPAPARAVPAHRLRALLAGAGMAASNKVVECMVVRYSWGGRLSPDAFLVALARLHLAHERYRALESKVKSNPLSLEEMILMTIYS